MAKFYLSVVTTLLFFKKPRRAVLPDVPTCEKDPYGPTATSKSYSGSYASPTVLTYPQRINPQRINPSSINLILVGYLDMAMRKINPRVNVNWRRYDRKVENVLNAPRGFGGGGALSLGTVPS